MNDKSLESSDGKEKVIKSPLEKALERIKSAYILAFIIAGVNTVFVILAASGYKSGYSIIDETDISIIVNDVFVLIFGILLLTIKSRVAAIILFINYLYSRIIMFIEYPAYIRSAPFLNLALLVVFFLGILGTFSYHKIKKQQSLEAPSFSGEL